MSIKHLVVGVALLAAASSFNAGAVTKYGRSFMYFDANENLVGQGILFCNNKTQHQGVTSGDVRVIIAYDCNTYETSSISYENASPDLRAAFCTTWGAGQCDDGPNPNNDLTGPWESGLYSN